MRAPAGVRDGARARGGGTSRAWRMRGLALVGLLALGCSSSGGSTPALPADGAAQDDAAGAGAVEGDAAGRAAGAGAGTREAAGTREGDAARTGEGGEEPADAVVTSKDPTATIPKASAGEDPWLAGWLASNPDIARLMEDPARYRLQVLVTVIAPKAEGEAEVRTSEHGYRVDVEYVYPASAIKTFAAVSAMRKLEALRQEGHAVGLDTPVALCASARGRGCKTKDESNVEGGVITLGHEVRKMQLVSNNFSFNRLYDFVGHREINEDLWALGFESMRMHHRLYSGSDPDEQRRTPRVELRPLEGERVVVPARRSTLELPATKAKALEIGTAYIDDELRARVDEPMDFAGKNYVSVRDLHRLTLALCRPELPGVPRLGLAPADREFLLQAMTEDPLQSKNPIYTDEHDSGLRYHTMIKGMLRVMPLERILYTGKAGKAYGFHLDNAYVEDRQSGRAMAVTVVAYANADGVLNDNVYEYDTVTRPLLLGLGELLGRAVLLGESMPPALRSAAAKPRAGR